MNASTSGPVFMIFDHNATHRQSLAAVLRDHGIIVYEVENTSEALETAERVRPAAIVTDIDSSLSQGLALIRKLRSSSPGSRIIAMSNDDDLIYSAMSGAGGIRIVHKPIPYGAALNFARKFMSHA